MIKRLLSYFKKNLLSSITNDWIWIIWSKLTGIGTAKHCFILYENGEFKLDRKKWIKFIKMISNGCANGTRLIPYGFWKFESTDPDIPAHKRFTPYVYDKVKGLWDLAKFNDYYFPILREMFQIAKDHRIVIWWSLFDNCQNHNKFKTPWKNNIQGINRFYQDRTFTKLWMDKCLKEFKGFWVAWELGNEIGPDGVSMEVAHSWAVDVLHYLLSKNLNPENLCFGAKFADIKYNSETYEFGSKYRSLLAELKKSRTFKPENLYGGEHTKKSIFRPAHRCGDMKTEDDKKFPKFGIMIKAVLYWLGMKAHKIALWFSTDGTRQGGVSCDQDLANNKIRPGVERWENMLDLIFSYDSYRGKIAIEHLPSKKASDRCQEEILLTIAKKYKNKYGKFPRNKRNPINIEYPDTEDPVIPEPTKPEINKPWIKWSLSGLGILLFIWIMSKILF